MNILFIKFKKERIQLFLTFLLVVMVTINASAQMNARGVGLGGAYTAIARGVHARDTIGGTQPQPAHFIDLYGRHIVSGQAIPQGVIHAVQCGKVYPDQSPGECPHPQYGIGLLFHADTPLPGKWFTILQEAQLFRFSGIPVVSV